MNPAVLMKLMVSPPSDEGTILDLTLTRPGEEPVTTNFKVKYSDLALMESLKDLMKNK